MSRRLLCWLLVPILLMPVHAQSPSSATAIREGRNALEAGEPGEARRLFAAALADPDRDPADTYAAAFGLGKSALWIGDYAEAASAFTVALEHAADSPEKEAASTGLAQSLNAQDYPRAAYALVAPFAKGRLSPTLEVLRALQSLGWQDKSPAFIEAVAASKTPESSANRYRMASEDMSFALAPQIEVNASTTQDSDGLAVHRVGSAFRFAPRSTNSVVQTWGMAANTGRVSGESGRWSVESLSVRSRLRINDTHHVDLDVGAGRIDGWNFAQGASSWTRQASDAFSFTAVAERAPILTDLAIVNRLAVNTYSLGVAVRPSARWFVLPSYYRQAFTDGNTRDGATLRIRMNSFDLTDTPASLGAELSTRIFHSTHPSRGVYFNPARYRVMQLSFNAAYALTPDWKLRAKAGAGRQVIDGNGAAVYSAQLAVDGRLPSNGRFDFMVERSSAASESGSGGPGYWSNGVALSVRYPL